MSALFNHATPDSIDSSRETLRPTKDRILVKPLDWSPNTAGIVAIRTGRPVRGVAIACGPGTFRKKYSADRSQVTETHTFIPMTVKPGDILNWGGLNIYDGAGYSYPEIMIDGEIHLIVQEQDIVIEDHGN